MPEHEQWVYIDTSSTGTTYTWTWDRPLSAIESDANEEYIQECELQDRIYELQIQMQEQQMEEERQLIEDKRKYPLFFLKEGIV